MTISWQGVAVLTILVGGAVASYALEAKEMAMMFVGFAGGLFAPGPVQRVKKRAGDA